MGILVINRCKKVIHIFDLNNFLNITFQQIVLIVPLFWFFAIAIFLLLNRIPSRLIQWLIPLVVGIIFTVYYTMMDPSNPKDAAFLILVTGMLIHPLLILPPVILMQKYLNHLPRLSAVVFALFISLCFIVAWGVFQSSGYDESQGIIWQSVCSVLIDLIAASAVAGMVIGLDNYYPHAETKTL